MESRPARTLIGTERRIISSAVFRERLETLAQFEFANLVPIEAQLFGRYTRRHHKLQLYWKCPIVSQKPRKLLATHLPIIFLIRCFVCLSSTFTAVCDEQHCSAINQTGILGAPNGGRNQTNSPSTTLSRNAPLPQSLCCCT